MKPLAEPALAASRDGTVTFVPERWKKVYEHWMENIRDWCISRQLWWGHRIPVWYCRDCGETIVAREDPDVCPGLRQHGPGAGSGRPGHLVLLLALALLGVRLARARPTT